MENTNNFQISEHFNLREFECPCCKRVIVNAEMLKKLEWLRRRIKSPLTITSGFRCVHHNRDVGGHTFSLHMQGRAVDLYIPDQKAFTFDVSDIFPGWYYNKEKKYYHCQLDKSLTW